MGDKYKLHYFNAKGWAEPARLILSYGKADWEDLRFTGEIPADIKTRAPYGQVPLLEHNGQIIAQSQTISRYLARKFNLVGSTPLEVAQCDEIVDAVKDFGALWIAVIRETDEEKKAEALKKAVGDSKTRFVSKFNEIAEANGGHMVGKSLTWADIYVAHFLAAIETRSPVPILGDFAAVKALIETVNNTPGIKEYIEKRPVTEN